MTLRPAARLGLAGGRLEKGAPGDLTLIDLDTPWVLDPAQLHSKSKNTPFEDRAFQGRVIRTIVGGRTVYDIAAAD